MEKLDKRVADLERVVVGQTAMIAALVGILHAKGALSPEESMAVLVAEKDVEQGKALTPDQVLEWARARFSK